jgi:hypothetical protein
LQCVVLHADFAADYSFVIRSILNYLCIFYPIRIYVFFLSSSLLDFIILSWN